MKCQSIFLGKYETYRQIVTAVIPAVSLCLVKVFYTQPQDTDGAFFSFLFSFSFIFFFFCLVIVCSFFGFRNGSTL